MPTFAGVPLEVGWSGIPWPYFVALAGCVAVGWAFGFQCGYRHAYTQVSKLVRLAMMRE